MNSVEFRLPRLFAGNLRRADIGSVFDNPFKDNDSMNEQFDIVNLLKDKKALLKYMLDMITSSEKFAQNLPQLRQRGWSEQGMLNKVIEITAIQSQQIKHLALVALIITQSRKFDGSVGEMMINMGRGEDALKAMFDAKLKG